MENWVKINALAWEADPVSHLGADAEQETKQLLLNSQKP
mgnify:CR=1 FL=1